MAQTSNCGQQTTPNDLAYSRNISSVESQIPPFTWEIPVRAIVFLDDYFPDPTQSIPASVDDAAVDAKIAVINNSLSIAPYSFHLYRFEPVIYIAADELHKGSINGPDFVYAEGILNIYIFDGPQAPQANFPWHPIHGVYLSGNQNDFDNGNFIHEIGHALGLFHSHNPTANFRIPAVPSQSDYPTKLLGRELVIRSPLPASDQRPFHIPNYDLAGDQVEDTPPGCDFLPSFYPSSATIGGCLDNDPNIPCINGCADGDPNTPCETGCKVDFNTCTYIGDYRDYNLDLITDPSGNMVRNYMSYFNTCYDRFTPDQAKKVHNTLLNSWGNTLTTLCGTHQDRVEIRNTNKGVDGVSLKITNTAGGLETKAMTDSDGDFSGRLFNTSFLRDMVTADVRKIKKHDIRKYDDTWLSYVNTFDLLVIQKHLLGAVHLDGYSILSADANKSNTLTPTDLIELRKLILGMYPNGLPKYVQPYRFVPETVTLTSGLQTQPDFDGLGQDNPFNTIDQVTNQAVSALNYCEPHYNIFMLHGSPRNGFDAVKIGDASNDWTFSSPPPNECEESVFLRVSNSKIDEGEVIQLDLKGTFSEISAFQLGLNLPKEYFEFVKINGESIHFSDSEETIGSGFFQTEDQLRIVWMSEDLKPIVRTSDEPFISIELKAKKDISNLENVIRLSSDEFSTQFFTTEGDCSGKVTLDVDATIVTGRSMKDSDESLDHKIAQLSCFPNPAVDNLTVLFDNIQKEQNGTLKFFSIDGKLL